MKKCRIIKREFGSKVEYVIQQKHFLFWWWWVDAWVNSYDGPGCIDSFPTLDEAKDNLKFYNGSKSTETVVYEYE